MKRWFKYILVVIVVLVVLGICHEARGQGCPDDYGCFLPYRSDIWPRDGLVGRLVLDPGVEGSFLVQEGDYGDFESFTGAEGGCTNCPEGCNCDCTTFGGDVDSNSTYIHKTDTSVDITPAGNLTGIIYFTRTFARNEVYQFSFCYRGAAGTEDLQFGAGNISFTETYDWTSNTWTAPLTTMAFANIGTSWTCATAYMTAGVATKTSYMAAFAASTADGTAIYIDNVRFNRVKTEGVVGDLGNVVSVDDGSDQRWGTSEVLFPRTGTGPAYKTGMWLDGVDDYLDGGDILSPADGRLTVACWTLPNTVTGTHTPISQWHSVANQCSYLVNFDTDDVKWYVDDDGTGATSTMIQDADVLVADTEVRFVATYEQIDSGSSNMTLRVNNETEVTSAVAVAPIWDSTGDFCIGAAHGGANPFSGHLLQCMVWHKVLDSVGRNKVINPYFPATDYGDGFYVETCSQAASHAICSTQVCVDGAPNTCYAEGTGVMACYNGYDEELDNNSFEAYAGDPSDGDFDDWPTEAGVVTAYLADSKHGNVSARMQGGSMTGECIIGGGSDTYFEISAKQLNNGGGTIEVWLREYDTGFCTDQLAITMPLITCTPGGVWDDCGALFAAGSWNVATSSYKIQIVDTVDGDMLIDNVSIKEASYHTPFVHCPTGSGSVTYNSRQYELDSPLARYSESDYAYNTGFCGSMWLYTDWPGDDGVTHQIVTSPGTAGIDNRWIINKPNSNNIQFVLYDAAGALRQYALITTGTNWTAGGWKFLEWCSNNIDDVLRGRHYNVANGIWYAWSGAAGAGTGVQDGQAVDLHIGHDANANYLDGDVSEIHLSPYPSGAFTWPQKGFNGGRPPVNESPY